MLGDTGNKRAVRILLECILVSSIFKFPQSVGILMEVTIHIPSLHAVDDAQVILVSLPASLELVEQETQLHADHQARHAQEDITPHLQ